MTTDPSLSVRGKIVAALKSDPDLNLIVPPARVYPAKTAVPVLWPFIRVPLLDGVPDELDGGSGSRQSGVIHCFTKAKMSKPPAPDDVDDPEAQAAQINAAVVRIVSGIEATALGDGESLGVQVILTQVIQDTSEADAFHGLVTVQAYAT